MAVGEIVAGAVQGIASPIVSAYNAYKERELEENKRKELKGYTDQAASTYDQLLQKLEAYRQGQTRQVTPEMQAAYQNLISGYNPEDYVYDFDKFEYGKTADDFLNPYYDKIIKGTADTLQHTAAGAGVGRGTGAALNIAQGVAEKEDELYKTAMDEYNTDRSQSYKEYSDYIANMQNKLNNLSTAKSNQISLLGGAIAHDEQQDSDYMSDIISLLGDKASTKLQGYAAAYA